ncbi:MAG: L-threonylcarbamoyladenylate synthase [Chitinophagaceae bacterium]
MDFQQDIDQCLKTLSDGGLILYPTDTIWGIGCDATNSEAVKKVYALKQRADEKALIVLLSDERDVLQYVAGADLSVFDYLQQTSKPTTVIYEGAIGLADNLIGGDGSIAIRLCRDPFCRHLLKRFRKPIVSTSANISGQSSAPFFKQVSAEIKSGVDYVVRHRQDDETVAVPSAIIKWKNGGAEVIRG